MDIHQQSIQEDAFEHGLNVINKNGVANVRNGERPEKSLHAG